MTPAELEQLRFPIGHFIKPETIHKEFVEDCIADIERFPERLRREVEHLGEIQLDTAYRPDGWTIRQVVHHCADSHMNSFTRFKLALTEDNPTIKPYWEDRWAELADSKMSISASLNLLDALHARWVVLLRSLTSNELSKTFVHPEHGKEFVLDEYVAFYAWHCNHHLAHIIELKKRKVWQ